MTSLKAISSQPRADFNYSALPGPAVQEAVQLCLIATYFGPLPSSFQLWLHSCAANSQVQFLVLTDQLYGSYQVPPNVRFEHTTLSELQDIFSARLGVSVALNKPYKMCDFKPFYWILVDWFEIACSHWGHCDLDVIFGDLQGFITVELLQKYDRLFELGHLSIYRNCDLVNSMCFSRRTGMRWDEVVTSNDHFGFDEHNGVNLAWELMNLRWYRDEHICFDVEPRVAAIQTCQFKVNNHRQTIYWENGHLFHAFRTLRGKVRIREIAYVHFQKRQLLPQFDSYGVTALSQDP